jgi:hypothetical protein
MEFFDDELELMDNFRAIADERARETQTLQDVLDGGSEDLLFRNAA